MTVSESGRIVLSADSPILVMCPRGFEIESIVCPVLPQFAAKIESMISRSTWGVEPGDKSYMVIFRYGDMTGRLRRAATRWAGAELKEAIDFFEKDDFFRLQFAKP